MKKIKLSLIILAIFSLFSIVYFNSFSLAKEIPIIDQKIDIIIGESKEIVKEATPEVKDNEKLRVIVNLESNSKSENVLDIKKDSKENINKLMNTLSSNSKSLDVIDKYENFNSLAVEADKDTIEFLKNSPLVKEVYPEEYLQIQLAQSTVLIGAQSAWNNSLLIPEGITGAGQTICLLDTGVDYTNPALGGTLGKKILAGYDFVNNDADPKDDNGHGTHLAGIIAGNGTVSTLGGPLIIKGVAPEARIIAEKVCDSSGSCSNINVLAGFNHCLNTISPKKLTAISMSIADQQSYTSTTCPTWMDSAINSAYNLGVPVVVSSGNQGFKNGISYPACSPNAISVGATYDANQSGSMGWTIPSGSCLDPITVDKVVCASNTWTNLDLMAPGARIISTSSSVGSTCGAPNSPISQAASCHGTSQAAAHVSGAIALIKQYYRPNFKANAATSIRIEKMLKQRTPITVTDTANNLQFPRLDVGFLG
jgi:subtilisin family serine protease